MTEAEKRLCDHFSGRNGSFFKALFDAMLVADSRNLARLARGFPEEARAVERYQKEEAYWPALEAEYNRRSKEMPECVNCGSRKSPIKQDFDSVLRDGLMLVCPDCDWPVGKPVPDEPLCSICRKRHGAEIEHACE
jgi:hypothetical protein